ncbi:hypothetical protein BU14_2344s0001 [Porphyra umbilicalis]|uniref:Tetraspanin n=1 Tax=Porphyra umbilicalis TaxID=2786 RepID=A0A1X6NJC4_PORUM|nr:hypothetical protein BU14_2344s0001 [Porphyra umbilicalis]|eukprot:OSX68714.1 hypothetical protein BU14_2344s0001 [Porphyra umbilicalis]
MGRGTGGRELALTIHGAVVGLLLLGGVTLIAFGVVDVITARDSVVDLKYTGSSRWNGLLKLGVAAIIVGSVLAAVAVFGCLAVGRGGCSTVFFILFITLQVVLVALLVAVALLAITLATRDAPDGVRTFLSDSWKESVADAEYAVVVCGLEVEFSCRGFYNGQCHGCATADLVSNACTREQRRWCPRCDKQRPAEDFSAKGCFQDTYNDARKYFKPIGIVASVLSAIVVLDMLVVCCV